MLYFSSRWNTSIDTIDSSNKLLFYALVKGSFKEKKEKKCSNVLFELPHARPIISHDDCIYLSRSVLAISGR